MRSWSLSAKQGLYKTTWFNFLLPPELRCYFYTKTNSDRLNKDDLFSLTEFALICFEELDGMRPAELNQLKAMVTMPYVNERAATGATRNAIRISLRFAARAIMSSS